MIVDEILLILSLLMALMGGTYIHVMEPWNKHQSAPYILFALSLAIAIFMADISLRAGGFFVAWDSFVLLLFLVVFGSLVFANKKFIPICLIGASIGWGIVVGVRLNILWIPILPVLSVFVGTGISTFFINKS